jgi:N-acetylglucosaminylphosphatidylinositol deacetylase
MCRYCVSAQVFPTSFSLNPLCPNATAGAERHLCDTRKSELLKSAGILGLRSSSDVAIVEDHGRFPDSMTTPWDPDDIAVELSHKFSPSLQRKSPNTREHHPVSSQIDIDVLITFDTKGISSHANHISLYYGALKWLRDVDPTGSLVSMYSLTTTGIFRKYIAVFDAGVSILQAYFSRGSEPIRHSQSARLVFVSGISDYRTAQRAMTEGHKSQMLWFRYGWLCLSRYVSVNDLVRRYPTGSSP